MDLHHVGIVVRKIGPKLGLYKQLLGMEVVLDGIHDPIQKVNLCFLKAPDGHLVELIEPASDDSPVKRAADKGGGINHLCYSVDSIEDTVEQFRDARALVVCEPVEAVAFNRRRVAFIVHPGLGVVEFVERKSTSDPWPV